MRRKNTIPTPWRHRWRRFRYRMLPILGFLACAALTAWLWPQQGRLPNAVGEVETVRVDVAAGSDGLLLSLPNGPWTLFDTARADQVIARLDDRPAQARLDTLHAELARLRTEVDAEQVRIDLVDVERQQTQLQEKMRLAWQVARCRLDVLDRKATIEGDRIDVQRQDQELEFLKPLFESAELTDFAQQDRQFRRDEAVKRLEENSTALSEAERLLSESEKSLQEHSAPEMPEVQKLLIPIKARIAEQESRIRALRCEIDSLEIRAPFTGTICAIHSWPGESVQAGDPIITLAADQGRFIVSYVRQEQRFRPSVGMPVAVRLREPGARPIETVVEQVGPQVELVPPHQRRDPAVMEWGQPVRIAPPRQLTLRPGELIDVTFHTRAKRLAGKST